MGKGESLSSISKGNWVEDNVLTKKSFNVENFEIYKNVIEKYSRKLKGFKHETEERLIRSNSGLINEFANETNEADDKESLPVLNFPRLDYSYDILNSGLYYRKVQNWQGIVTKINIDSFEARLEDLTAGGTDEIADFYLEEVSPSDLQLLQEGALFYWSVGRYMENGQSVNRSEIRFQRLITLDENDIEATKQNIESKYSNLKERHIDNTGAEY